MTPLDFWSQLFQGRTRSLEPPRAAVAASALAATHTQLYAGYLGPSKLLWEQDGAQWTFSSCPHGDRANPCEAHQGFLLGTLRGFGYENVEISRVWQRPRCCLALTWRPK